MARSLFQALTRLQGAWKPLSFINTNFTRIPLNQLVEEETLPDYVATTVWLARDLKGRQHVALKLFIHSRSMGSQLDDEINMYKRMEGASKRHPGRDAVRTLLDTFDLDGPAGEHRCLVHTPLWDSVLTFLYRNPVRRLPEPVLAGILQRVFLALDFLHTECKIVHADIKADNIMFGIEDDSVFSHFEQEELRDPCPRKEVDGRTIYTSRQLRMPKRWGAPVLCDFGSAMPGDRENWDKIQPDIYRAPEVILEAPWTYSADMWNVGCMIWDIFEGGHLFTGKDPELKTYKSRAHLAEMVALLGPPPATLLARGKLSDKFFSQDGKSHPSIHDAFNVLYAAYHGELCTDISLPDRTTLEERETTLAGQDKASFLRLVRKLLAWEPAERGTPNELMDDEWILKHTRE
ncbi:hypothetical protein ACRALDRAFT_2094969 [Sodiomyces alcalophilus JCM 7366]|uniref:uncharacterized protein n=1 Tax=Sodiomyces alcalophilus JCM 7366 TaxID=591952 RepID=UPI0039B51826